MKFKGYIAILLVHYPHDMVICSILGLLSYALAKIPNPTYSLSLYGVVKSINGQCNVQCLMFKVQCSMSNIQRPLGIVHSFHEFIVHTNLIVQWPMFNVRCQRPMSIVYYSMCKV